jgi:predicted RNA polymerase sigma factor
MSTQDTGGPAFPESGPRGQAVGGEGMTLRDYFAAKAMQGILFEGLEPEQTAKHAYDMADAMLKARAQ